MDWKQYRNNFIREARIHEYDSDYIKVHTKYAYKLFQNNLPVIYDVKHLSYLLGYSEEFLYKISNSSSPFYRVFKIPKKRGGFRTIAEPLPNLKNIQKWILEEILYNYNVSDFAKAYKKGISIRDNARFHRRQKKVLTVDIQDFFSSIRFMKVYFIFVNSGYSKKVSVVLANLCCYKGSLPQGAITSPALSNIVFEDLDRKLVKFSVENKIRYTRYADDLTFSGDLNVKKVIEFIERTLMLGGYKLNKKKTRVKRLNERQEVTGIIVNEKLQAPREMRKKLRQDIYYIKKHGLASHKKWIECEDETYLQHLIGLAYHMVHLNPKDEEIIGYIHYLKKMINQYK